MENSTSVGGVQWRRGYGSPSQGRRTPEQIRSCSGCLLILSEKMNVPLPSLRFFMRLALVCFYCLCVLFMFSILSRRCPLLATSCPSFFCLLSMLISDSRFDLVWFRLSCDHGWIRSGSVNVRKQQQQQPSIGGKWYTLIVRDDCTRFTRVYFRGKKPDTANAFKSFLAEVRAGDTPSAVMAVRSDSGGGGVGRGFRETMPQAWFQARVNASRQP